MILIGYTRNLDQAESDLLSLAGCEKIYSDGGQRGKAGLAAALKVARLGDQLIIASLASLGLGVRGLVLFAEQLRFQGVHLRSLAERIDTRDDPGWSFFVLACQLAEAEREVIRQNLARGLPAARRTGARNGGRKHALTAEQVEQARQLLADPNTSVRQLARKYKVSKMTIYRNVVATESTERPRAASATPLT